MKKLDILIVSYTDELRSFDITYVCAKLLSISFPKSNIYLFRMSPDLNFSEDNKRQKLELVERGIKFIYCDDMYGVADRGARNLKSALSKYLNFNCRNEYAWITFQDCWLVNDEPVRKNIQETIDLGYDGLTNHAIVRNEIVYETVSMLLKSHLFKYFVDHNKLGVFDCESEFEIFESVKNFNLNIANTPLDALSQYIYNYNFGTIHFHEKESMQFYLNARNNLYPDNKKVLINWSLIPKVISINERERTRSKLKSPDNVYDLDVKVSTGLDDCGTPNNLPFNGNDSLIKIDEKYFYTKNRHIAGEVTLRR